MRSLPSRPELDDPPESPFGGIAGGNLYWWRYDLAEEVGMEPEDCHAFARSRVSSTEDLRRLIKLGCPPALLARILL